jgi:hypothetical protein
MCAMSLSTFAALAAETEAHSEPALNPWLVGAITLALLLAMLGALVAFGGGREHS